MIGYEQLVQKTPVFNDILNYRFLSVQVIYYYAQTVTITLLLLPTLLV